MMMNVNKLKNLFSMTLIACLLAACASKPVKEAPTIAEPTTPPPAAQQQPASTEAPPAQSAPAKASIVEVNPLTDPANILSKRSVYFDYDKFVIKPEFQAMIEAHAKYLVDHPQASVKLEGNADDRGSHEYNLALGQKRAVAVRAAMSVLGVSDKQIETISYGMEKPRALGHDEASWAENRRADIVYHGE
jgi:peptidoglycan-associated lipoprotein